jgi:hypothetical protein
MARKIGTHKNKNPRCANSIGISITNGDALVLGVSIAYTVPILALTWLMKG